MDSDGSYSDLTDLESDEYKEKPKKKPTGNVPKNGGYRIKNALKVPRATTYTAQALYGACRRMSSTCPILTVLKTKSIVAILILNQTIREVRIR